MPKQIRLVLKEGIDAADAMNGLRTEFGCKNGGAKLQNVKPDKRHSLGADATVLCLHLRGAVSPHQEGIMASYGQRAPAVS